MATLVLFPTPPEFLLSALLQGTTLPVPDGQPYPVLIAPGIPRLWRQATAEEAHLFTLCQETLTVAQIAAEQPGLSRPLQTLLAARTLCVE